MSWHRFITIEASFECDPIGGWAAKGARSLGPLTEIPDPDELAQQFLRAVGRPTFGRFIVRESRYTAVRPGSKMVRMLIRQEMKKGSAPARRQGKKRLGIRRNPKS